MLSGRECLPGQVSAGREPGQAPLWLERHRPSLGSGEWGRFGAWTMLMLCQRPQEDAPLRAGPLPPVGLLPPGTESEDRVHHSVSAAGTAPGASADPLKMPFPHPSLPGGCLWATRVGRATGSETQGEGVASPLLCGWVDGRTPRLRPVHCSSQNGTQTPQPQQETPQQERARQPPPPGSPPAAAPALTLTCQVCSSERQLLGQRRLEAVGGGGWGNEGPGDRGGPVQETETKKPRFPTGMK